MSVSSVIRIVHLSAEYSELSDQAKTPWNYFSTQNSTLNPHEIVTGLGLHIVTRSDPVSILPNTDPGYRSDTLKTIL